jgi:hypothetical protein
VGAVNPVELACLGEVPRERGSFMADRAQMRLNVFLPQIHIRDRRLGHELDDDIPTVRTVK